MPRIRVTSRAYELLLRHAQRELRGVRHRGKDGSWVVEISDELHANLESARFPHEPISHTVLRYLPTRGGGRR